MQIDVNRWRYQRHCCLQIKQIGLYQQPKLYSQELQSSYKDLRLHLAVKKKKRLNSINF